VRVYIYISVYDLIRGQRNLLINAKEEEEEEKEEMLGILEGSYGIRLTEGMKWIGDCCDVIVTITSNNDQFFCVVLSVSTHARERTRKGK
jgi:hypothetical protein